MGTWWSDHPDLEGLARRGRNDLSADEATAEADTEQLRKRRRSLVDLCFEWMGRGDRVTLGVFDTQFDGHLVAAADSAGSSGERSVGSFRAYLGAAEVDQRRVRLVGRAFDVTGVIDASTDDHWLVIDEAGTSWALPSHAVGYCLTPAPE